MGIFDIFSTGPAQQASGDLNRGITTGLGSYNQYAGQGQNALGTNYASALQPFQQNYGTATGGVNQLGNLLGLGGASGNASALQSLQNTPGYQFQLQQGNNAVLANQAATGQLASGNTDLALQKYGQGLAGTTYQNAVQNLQPYLGMAQNSASGIGGLYSNLGNQLNQSFQNQGQANYGANAAIGQSNANADLSAYNASGNLLNFGMNLAKMFAGGAGGMGGAGGGGSLFSGLGSGIGSAASGIGSGVGSAASGIGSGIGNFFGMQNAPGGSPTGLAEGGRPSLDQPTLVGERGPELFVPDTPGTIVPNNFAAGLRPYLEGGAMPPASNDRRITAPTEYSTMDMIRAGARDFGMDVKDFLRALSGGEHVPAKDYHGNYTPGNWASRLALLGRNRFPEMDPPPGPSWSGRQTAPAYMAQ